MGFRTLIKKNITLTVGAAPVADFRLPVGSASETVDVERNRASGNWNILNVRFV
jgi:hypothetical protein